MSIKLLTNRYSKQILNMTNKHNELEKYVQSIIYYDTWDLKMKNMSGFLRKIDIVILYKEKTSTTTQKIDEFKNAMNRIRKEPVYYFWNYPNFNIDSMKTMELDKAVELKYTVSKQFIHDKNCLYKIQNLKQQSKVFLNIADKILEKYEEERYCNRKKQTRIFQHTMNTMLLFLNYIVIGLVDIVLLCVLIVYSIYLLLLSIIIIVILIITLNNKGEEIFANAFILGSYLLWNTILNLIVNPSGNNYYYNITRFSNPIKAQCKIKKTTKKLKKIKVEKYKF